MGELDGRLLHLEPWPIHVRYADSLEPLRVACLQRALLRMSAD